MSTPQVPDNKSERIAWFTHREQQLEIHREWRRGQPFISSLATENEVDRVPGAPGFGRSGPFIRPRNHNSPFRDDGTCVNGRAKPHEMILAAVKEIRPHGFAHSSRPSLE